MANLDVDDVVQMYLSSVVLYVKELVYVRDVTIEENQIYIHIEHLCSREQSMVLFDMAKFKSPGRIGYVNYGHSAWFLSRIPARVFKVGLAATNTRLVPTAGFGQEMAPLVHSVGVYNAHANNYPSLYKAWCYVKDKIACQAFDHQFAICNRRYIYYKGKRVGNIPKGHVRKSNIIWNNGYEYLSDLVDPDYEKTVRTFK